MCVCACLLQAMMRVELLYGSAGLVGSLVSGHLFLLYSSSVGHGTVLLIVSTLLHLLSLIFSIALLQVSNARHGDDLLRLRIDEITHPTAITCWLPGPHFS